ncbi:FecR domain-containing protein [Niastella sp. OAS944]|uniref:FecR domain-containing protein n=1 Tax=Niastella sp. OAS944 TaxID=2664089 RepID=UPI0035C82054|nr:ferric-dicitrate binding protein FerR (iron transport regulator) [Chitinophagaceae bacterium OAS944]
MIIKHLQETITAEESITLEQWLAASEENRSKFDRIANEKTLREDLLSFIESDQRIKERVYAKLPEVQDALIVTPKRNYMRWLSVAAAVLVVGGAGIWMLRSKEASTTKGTEQQVPMATTIPAGGNKATLTLADGTVIDLDKAGNGTIATEGKTKVNKKEDGQLEYKSTTSTRQSSITYNLLSTPRGGQYQLILPDGSKVWLNAASSIKYPTAFSDNERIVEITGEAYFEIANVINKAENEKVPFVVKANEIEVEVLGTHFNMNVYSDEDAVRTTLLEGRVKLKLNGTDTYSILQPGQQATWNKKSDEIKKFRDVDVEEVVAWKNGYFQFSNSDIKAVMRQLERWYDVKVEYHGTLPDKEFVGTLPRSLDLSKVLMLLEKQNVHFKIDGRKIIVSP